VKIDSTLRQVFLRTYGYKPEKVLEIPHPCVQLEERTDQKAAEERLGVAGRKAILMFGFIRRGKGFETALRAIEIVRRKKPEILLLVAGRPQGFDSDRYMIELQNLISKLNLTENVRFDTRFIPDDEVPDYFAASTVLLIPYTESVGASGPIHNYAGYGVPILASDVGYHNRDTVGGNLFLFKAGNAEDLAQKLEVILANPELAHKMSRGQVEYARGEGWNVAGERTLSYYKKTLEM
jgi:glycosyltransferase involved in cell wall biosynthesis